MLIEIVKVADGLGAFFLELCGDGARVTMPKDITVGWETQIVAFTLEVPGEDPLELIARIYPVDDGARKAEWEFNVMQHLASVGYPVPKVYAYEADVETLGSPFLIMERITGNTLWDVFFGSPKERYGKVLALNSRLMANLHDIPVRRVIPGVYLVKTKHRVLGRVSEEQKELTEHGLGGIFAPLIEWLKDNAERVVESPLCIIHQDFHPRNVLLREDGSPVVIDWAGCTVGDFREDLCWTGLLAGTFINDSLRQEVYDSYAEYSARELLDLPYFEAFAGLRRLADVAITLKVGASARGMRPEALTEMENNRPHYSKVLARVEVVTELSLAKVGSLIGV
jgi:aminoglycoside phosphotransferase (APT) family kinase protein